MLVEFRVKNFKSIRDEQVLSMVASKDTSFEDTHVLTPGGISFKLLKSAAIYGPNAGGKSNLLQAFDFMRWNLNSRDRHYPATHFSNDEYDKRPFFKLDMTSRNSPSEFEVTYIDIEKGVRYQYGFSLFKDRIVEEWLLVYESYKPQEWFHRTVDEKTGEDNYKFSPYFRGQKLTWQKSTRKEALFLAVASELNSEQLQPVYQWLLKLRALNRFSLSLNNMNPYLFENKRAKRNLLDFLIAADLGITDVYVKTETIKTSKYSKEGTSQELVEGWNIRPIFVHLHNGTKEHFEFEEESEGTQNMFLLAFYILEVLKLGMPLIVDELENSLHPKLVLFITKLFNSVDNKNGAQLIFSTHNTSLLDIRETFRRDQIWFAEKDNSQATNLYSLTDFNPRKDAAVESGYLTGRYGAIPFMSEFIPNMSENDDGP
jgi:AAA15 family ATPase/GTPase